jgi:2-C-methyl-D-erythritol 4-phosphate cytidylyltransferase/2-C-methyl-D-erythritol 2,4-cyclodiphosphate synthase
MQTSKSTPRCFALLPCAGTGSRAGTAQPKQYQPVAGVPMVRRTLAAFAAAPRIDRVLVVVAPGDDALRQHDAAFIVTDCGGATRAESVFNGLTALRALGARADDWVLVHDAARCLVTPAQIDALIDACLPDAVGGLLALPLPDTLKATDADGRVASTIDRASKWLAQTPQMFRIGLLRDALAAHAASGFAGITDEASAIESVGHRPLLVRGSARNFKVTYPEDFALAEAVLTSMTTQDNHSALPRIGEGWDVHALVPGRPLVIGGVHIPHTHGLLGHSDADVLLHAITDALLGAAGLGDIGRHFPDTAPCFAGADSAALLAEAARRVKAAGWRVGNVDGTVIAQAPKLAPHISAMTARIAAVLDIDAARVNVKAKTAERLGPVGQGACIEARAVVLLG